MFYEISVDKLEMYNSRTDYHHYFTTTPRSVKTRVDAMIMYDHFIRIFKSPSYKVTARQWPEAKEDITSEMHTPPWAE